MIHNCYVCERLGDINDLKISSIKIIKLKKNQVRVKILTIGVNYVDYLMIKGLYQHKNSLPFIPGGPRGPKSPFGPT